MKKKLVSKINRRDFIKKTALATSACVTLPGIIGCAGHNNDQKIFLLRYDVEYWGDWKEMDGFIEKVISVQNSMEIPATFFCKGKTLNDNKEVFKHFYKEVRNNPLFDFQDHSYSHIGLGYSRGKPVDVLRADYEKSFNFW